MAKKNKRKDGGSGLSSKLEEDPILAKALARTDMGSGEGQMSTISVRHVEIEGRSIAVMFPNEATVDTEADVDSTEELNVIPDQCPAGDTSDNASKTLEDKDSFSTGGVRQNAQPNLISSQVVKGKSWASLFEKNMLPTIGSKLQYINLEEGPIQLGEVDSQLSDCPWERCLVGYFGGNQIVALWKVHPTYQFHGSGWIVFRFASTEDQIKVLENGPYMIYGSPLLLKPMTKYFSFGKEAISSLGPAEKCPSDLMESYGL